MAHWLTSFGPFPAVAADLLTNAGLPAHWFRTVEKASLLTQGLLENTTDYLYIRGLTSTFFLEQLHFGI